MDIGWTSVTSPELPRHLGIKLKSDSKHDDLYINNHQITDRFFIIFPGKRGIIDEAFLKSVSIYKIIKKSQQMLWHKAQRHKKTNRPHLFFPHFNH